MDDVDLWSFFFRRFRYTARKSARDMRIVQLLVGFPQWVKFLIFLGLDAVSVSIATLAAGVVIHPQSGILQRPLASLLVASWATVLPALATCGCYNAVTRFPSIFTMLRLLRSMVMGYLALAVVMVGMGSATQEWNLLLLIPFYTGFFLMFWRVAGAMILRPAVPSDRPKPVMIYGAGEAGIQLSAALMRNRHYRPVGFIDDNPNLNGRFVGGLKVYSRTALPPLKEEGYFERVLLALPSISRNRRREILEALERLAIKVLVIPALAELASGERRIDELREVQIEDLLGRDAVSSGLTLANQYLKGKTVMVTGAGGSIGGELCRQSILCGARKIVLLEMSEFALYSVEQKLGALAASHGCRIVPVLDSACEKKRVVTWLVNEGVQIIYHAAAYKHVPLVESNIVASTYNNVFATLSIAQAAIAASVENLVLISSDKAVRPTSAMGASKRVCELIIQALAAEHSCPRMSIVRFGNVLESSGSVVPLFREQIRKGGPVTVTHPDITRYFMTIPEAAQLVIQAGAMGYAGDVFVLDMGEPIKISDLAQRMIRLSGLEPRLTKESYGDIAIEFTGLRPGEKLFEELLLGDNPKPTAHPRIFLAHESFMPWARLSRYLDRLKTIARLEDVGTIINILSELVDGYRRMDIVVKTQKAMGSETSVEPITNKDRLLTDRAYGSI